MRAPDRVIPSRSRSFRAHRQPDESGRGGDARQLRRHVKSHTGGNGAAGRHRQRRRSPPSASRTLASLTLGPLRVRCARPRRRRPSRGEEGARPPPTRGRLVGQATASSRDSTSSSGSAGVGIQRSTPWAIIQRSTSTTVVGRPGCRHVLMASVVLRILHLEVQSVIGRRCRDGGECRLGIAQRPVASRQVVDLHRCVPDGLRRLQDPPVGSRGAASRRARVRRRARISTTAGFAFTPCGDATITPSSSILVCNVPIRSTVCTAHRSSAVSCSSSSKSSTTECQSARASGLVPTSVEVRLFVIVVSFRGVEAMHPACRPSETANRRS